MKVSAARSELLDAISVVSRGLSSRSTLPILSSILLDAKGDELVLHSTDLEVSLKHSMAARIDEEGTAVVPGRLLTDIVRSMPEAAVTLETTSPDDASISCEQSSFDVRTLHAEDFPKFPEVSPEKGAVLPADRLVSVIKQVSRAASKDETRPVLTGVLTMIEPMSLKMVATDSYRLAVRQVEIDGPDEPIEVVIPNKAVDEIPRLAGSAERISLGVAENQVVFEFGNTVFVSRRIDGRFPNYAQLIPTESETRATVGREELLEAVKRVSILAQHNVPLRVSIRPEDRVLTLSASTPDIGEASEDLEVDAEGEEVEIAFNSSFMIDGVGAAGTEQVALETTSPLKPGLLSSVGDEEYIYILMPVRIG
jgi:DNA polymerase-3 subunit beta